MNVVTYIKKNKENKMPNIELSNSGLSVVYAIQQLQQNYNFANVQIGGINLTDPNFLGTINTIGTAVDTSVQNNNGNNLLTTLGTALDAQQTAVTTANTLATTTSTATNAALVVLQEDTQATKLLETVYNLETSNNNKIKAALTKVSTDAHKLVTLQNTLKRAFKELCQTWNNNFLIMKNY
jgi:hypothetical protein